MKYIFPTFFLMFIFIGCSRQYDPLEIVSTPNAPAVNGPYSQAVRAGNTLYLSGQLGLDPATGKFTDQGFEAQARQALENQKAILESAGFSLKDVVQCQVFLTDIGYYPAFNAIYSEYFDKNFPARAVLEVSHIPADGMVEIMMVAARSK